ncbi:uncharacterized protein LOC129586817 [Paramacrobiotus metropolitanus]|uniref:uncharacterized protein LOC129586817 n=1 Tax=Paramacrobiotus metropolitanus TaxID=2943436 RepID=UPI0024458661|nr:uncharacterized protein LOC129586817 [Paramacrobiotus metropolitanus]
MHERKQAKESTTNVTSRRKKNDNNPTPAAVSSVAPTMAVSQLTQLSAGTAPATDPSESFEHQRKKAVVTYGDGPLFPLPEDSPLLVTGPALQPRYHNSEYGEPVQPIDINPLLATNLESNKGWFEEHAKNLLEKTKLVFLSNQHDSASSVYLPDGSKLHPACSDSSINPASTHGTAFSLATGCDMMPSVSQTSLLKQWDPSTGQPLFPEKPTSKHERRPPTPQLTITHHDPRHIHLLRPTCKEPKAKRATAYLGVAEEAPQQRETIPRQYKFDDERQAYVHEDKDSEVVHNITCALDVNYEPSSLCTNVSLYYLTIRQKQASQAKQMFRDLRNHLHLSSENDTIDFVRIRTAQGDRRLHRDLMLPWMEPSEKYPNADLYAKCKTTDTFLEGSIERNFEEIASKRAKLIMNKSYDGHENLLKPDEGVLSSYDLQHHDFKDIELFLRFLYGRIQEDDIDPASLGHFVALAFDLGLYKLRQVMEEIIRHKLLHENPVDIMKFSAANNLYWLHVAAFDFITNNFYYYLEGQHFRNWTADALDIYIKADDLRLKTEFDVYRLVREWLLCDPTHLEHANHFLHCIRFFRMSTEEIYDCLNLNAQGETFDFAEMQLVITMHLFIQDSLKRGDILQLPIPPNRVAENLYYWDPRVLYGEVAAAHIFLNLPQPFVHESVIRDIQIAEKEYKNVYEAEEKARMVRERADRLVKDEEEKCRKMFEMMGICTEGRSPKTVEVLKSQEIQRLIPFMEPPHARWPWPGPPKDGGKLDHRKSFVGGEELAVT